MKMLASLALVVGALSIPAVSFAQAAAPVTRAEVRADLVRLESAGYNPATGDDASYPADIQAAEAKVAAEVQPHANSDFGGVPSGTSAAGSHASQPKPMSSCVGPASFCTPYFGS